MRKPLDNWNKLKWGYVFGQKTWYSDFHLGLDVIAIPNTPVYAPHSGRVTNAYGSQGGNTAYLYANGLVFRFMHLNQYGYKGEVKEGALIGLVGNTGSRTTGAHLHVDISKNQIQLNNRNNFIDPEVYFKEGEKMTEEDKKWIKDNVYFPLKSIVVDNVVVQSKEIKKKIDEKQCACGLQGEDKSFFDWLKSIFNWK